MRILFITSLLFICVQGFSQKDSSITTIEFVEILNGNEEEALYYFQNNWKILRDAAIKRNYIESYQLLQVPRGEEPVFDLMLVTTFQNEEKFDQREGHFRELIEEKGPLRLLNDLQPKEFRKSAFAKQYIRRVD